MRYGNKYHARKTVRDGIVFDSKREADRWQELKLLLAAGEIKNLQRQVEYELIPPQKREWRGDYSERAVMYIADFVYLRGGRLVVEDVKSPVTKTPDYRIKRKLMRWVHGIHISEVE